MKRKNGEVLADTLDLKDKRVIDVGSGDGALTRTLARLGARVSGIECNPKQLEKARSAEPAGGESYHEGVGENLPFETSSADIVIFFNSLHHIDIESQVPALMEAGRVLRPGGLVYVAEPLAEGPHFDLMQPVHDETAVREAAYGAVKKATGRGMNERREFTYIHPSRYENFEAFRETILRINPHREEDFNALEEKLRSAFDRLGEKTEEGVEFDQPMRINVMEKDDLQ